MNENLSDIHYSPIKNYNYSKLFEPLYYNGKVLTEKERRELVAIIDETISDFSSGLPLFQEEIENSRDKKDEYHTIDYVISSVGLFVILIMTDCLAASKYFILANTDYDRRFMRGKMMVILNEGFKRLYGFDARTRNKSEWVRLKPLMSHFSSEIQSQYTELTHRLEGHAKSSSWWREERNLETHLDAERLYLSRQEEVIESKVIMDNLKLYNTLRAVNDFLTNANACLLNFLVGKYKRGELAME